MVGVAWICTGTRSNGLSDSTATPGVAEIAVSTETEYTPGEKTSIGTAAEGSASAPSGETCRLSIVKPLTSKLIDPVTVRSMTARGLLANRHVGAMPTDPSRMTSKVVVPG